MCQYQEGVGYTPMTKIHFWKCWNAILPCFQSAWLVLGKQVCSTSWTFLWMIFRNMYLCPSPSAGVPSGAYCSAVYSGLPRQPSIQCSRSAIHQCRSAGIQNTVGSRVPWAGINTVLISKINTLTRWSQCIQCLQCIHTHITTCIHITKYISWYT